MESPFMESDFMESPLFIASPFMESPFMESPFIESPFLAPDFIESPFMESDFMESPFMLSELIESDFIESDFIESVWAKAGTEPAIATKAKEAKRVRMSFPPNCLCGDIPLDYSPLKAVGYPPVVFFDAWRSVTGRRAPAPHIIAVTFGPIRRTACMGG
jgi:hypothetical protein